MDINKYCEIPYDEDTFDCVDLVRLVQKELFGRDIQLTGRRLRGVRGQLAMGELSQAYAAPTDVPTTGDLVLMYDKGDRSTLHAGVYFFIAHEAYVLHVSQGTKQSVFQRVRELPQFGARIEGFYKWI